MTARSLTRGERQLAESVFGESIDYDAVRLIHRKWWVFQPRGIVMAPRGHIHFHPQCPHYCTDFAGADLTHQGLFIHEMTHVWQHQQGLNLLWRRHPFSRYTYHIEADRPFHRYGIEQQAEIVRHYFLLKNKAKVPGAPPLEQYEGVLPFGKKASAK